MSHKNAVYTAAIALGVFVLMSKYGSRVTGSRHGS